MVIVSRDGFVLLRAGRIPKLNLNPLVPDFSFLCKEVHSDGWFVAFLESIIYVSVEEIGLSDRHVPQHRYLYDIVQICTFPATNTHECIILSYKTIIYQL